MSSIARTAGLLSEAKWVAFLLLFTAAALRMFAGPASFDLTQPWVYRSDGLVHAMHVKTLVDSGWLGNNPYIGAPFGAAHLDYPQADLLHLLLIKAMALFTNDWVVVFNLFLLAGFFLAALTAFFVFRQLELKAPIALLGALLFAFLPYHLLRISAYGHVFLAAYYAIPIAVLLALRLWSRPGAGADAPVIPSKWSLAGAIVLGVTGVYYAFFASFLILVGAIGASLTARRLRPLISGGVLVAIVTLVAALQAIPTVLYGWQHGRNESALLRSPAEADIYGLKVTQLFVPQPDHRLKSARAVAAAYEKQAPGNESSTSSLGLIASVGLLVLLGAAFRRLASSNGAPSLLDQMAILCLAAIALGAVGGLGSLMAWTISPAIRAYNRLGVFVAFLSLAAVLLVLQRLTANLAASRGGVLAGLLAVIGVFGLWDQTSRLDTGHVASDFRSDRDFVARAEGALPAGAMIYQVPYHAFPESGSLHAMQDYDLFRGYLHSKALRWSYGSMKGREGDKWFRALSARPVDEQVSAAAAKGYTAVYVERRGFADRGAAVEQVLSTKIGPPLLVSRDGNLALYAMGR